MSRKYYSSIRSRSPSDDHHVSLKKCHFYQQSHCRNGLRCRYSHRGPPKGKCSQACVFCPRAHRRSPSQERSSRLESRHFRRSHSPRRSPEDRTRRIDYRSRSPEFSTINSEAVVHRNDAQEISLKIERHPSYEDSPTILLRIRRRIRELASEKVRARREPEAVLEKEKDLP